MFVVRETRAAEGEMVTTPVMECRGPWTGVVRCVTNLWIFLMLDIRVSGSLMLMMMMIIMVMMMMIKMMMKITGCPGP